jgi:hypothetical protein
MVGIRATGQRGAQRATPALRRLTVCGQRPSAPARGSSAHAPAVEQAPAAVAAFDVDGVVQTLLVALVGQLDGVAQGCTTRGEAQRRRLVDRELVRAVLGRRIEEVEGHHDDGGDQVSAMYGRRASVTSMRIQAGLFAGVKPCAAGVTKTCSPAERSTRGLRILARTTRAVVGPTDPPPLSPETTLLPS